MSVRVYASDDVVGVELGAELKTSWPLCMCHGMGFSLIPRPHPDDRRAIARLGVALSSREKTFAGPAW